MTAVKELASKQMISSTGKKYSISQSEFRCEMCNNIIVKGNREGKIAKSCGAKQCRKAAWVSSPWNKGKTKSSCKQNISYYTALKERYRLLIKTHTVCPEWDTLTGFISDMGKSYEKARLKGTKVRLVIFGSVVSKDTSKWECVSKFTSYPIVKGKQYLYLFKSGDYYKIGITANVQSRLNTMQTCNPVAVSLVYACLVPNARKAEKHLHFKYSDYSIHGEWFKFTKGAYDRILKDIIKYCEDCII